MAISDLTFSDIDPALIEQEEEFLVALLQEEYPSLDLTQSRVIRDQVIRPAAILRAADREDYDALRQSFSPVAITQDPSLADDDMVDSVFSNYRVTRFEGAKATGEVAVIISDLTTTLVPENTVFTANGLTFITDQPYIGVTSAASVVSTSERLIEERSDGSYVFTVPVTASETGEQYRILRGTRFTASPAVGGVIDLQAAQDFSGGLATETNEELVERVQAGIAPEVFSGRVQNSALLLDEFSNVQATSQVGFGDPEMLRDRDNIFETSNGGKADIYVRTADYPTEARYTKTATYLGDGLWQLTIDRDTAPGFYLVTAVVSKGLTSFSGSLLVTSEERGLDLTLETDWAQRIDGLVQGAYSRYQTAIIRFEDDSDVDGLVANQSTREYDVFIMSIPDIKGINDLTIDRDRRPPGGDYLPRAAVPAIMSCELLVQIRPGATQPTAAAIAQAVASRVNSLGFRTGRVQSALLIDAAMGVIESRGSAVVTPLAMAAVIYPPDTAPAGSIYLNDNDELLIPNLPDRGVSQRTTTFYLASENVDVVIESMNTISV